MTGDIEAQARELLRLDAEATPGPWAPLAPGDAVEIDSEEDGHFIAHARNTAPDLARAYLAVCRVLSDNGCNCSCVHAVEKHGADCVRCLACRIEAALTGGAP